MTYTINARAYLRQSAHACDIGLRYVQYALQIGCKVYFDEITVTPAQAELLDAKWRELNTVR